MALTITGVVMMLVASQLVESASLGVRVTRTLEHSRNARELLDRLSLDLRAAQVMRLYPSFVDRSSTARDGETGNYLVLQNVDSTGTITRTIGYYVTAQRHGAGLALCRHDSAAGDSAASALPDAASAGTHRVLKAAVRLPDSDRLFRCVRDRGVAIHGEFSTEATGGSGRTEFIQCTLFTRS